jgi:hypothetical protein
VIFDGFATAKYLDSRVAEEGKEVQKPVVYM